MTLTHPLSTTLFSHLASHSHLGAAHCNYSPFLRSHVQLLQRSWCFAFFPKGRKKESVTATLSLSQEFELATFQSLMCLQAIAVLFIIKHMPCLLLERKKCHIYDKITWGEQIYSAVVNDAKEMFFPAEHS